MHLNNDDMQQLFNNMEEGLERVTRTIQKMTISGHIDVISKQYFNINDCIKLAYTRLHKQLANTAKIELILEELPDISVNTEQMVQILSNLIINAHESMQSFGVIRVRSAVQNDAVVVSIEDNGCGIAKHQQEKIFDPFYTTKKKCAGTGLGLAIAFDIVHEHKGDLRFYSELGIGTTFILSIPIASKRFH